MSRPILRDKPLERVSMYIDRSALEIAQKKAIENGVDITTAGNASTFIRWLIDKYAGLEKE